MQRRHQVLLSNNHDFLVSEIPMDATLEAIKEKRILTWHDYDQLKSLRHQGRRALARYFLAVLPCRGPKAFQGLLESLQEANAQHLVDLLLEQAGAGNLEDLFKTPPPGAEPGESKSKGKQPSRTPSDTPLPPGPDPHEYAVRLSRNAKYIRKFVDPADISPILTQNKVLTAREADMVVHLHGKNKKWDLILAVLLQRGERAFQAFMAALLQKDYSTMFHTIQETTTEPSGSDDDGQQSGSDVDENPEDIMESDEEIKEETNKSRKSSVAEDLLQDYLSRSGSSKADDILLQASRDLQITDEGDKPGSSASFRNNSRLRNNENNGRDSVDDDNTGYYGQSNVSENYENDDYPKKENNRRGSRRKSSGPNLNSVQEEVGY